MIKTLTFCRSCFLHQVNEVALCGRSNDNESYGKNVRQRRESTASPDAQAAGAEATIPRRAAQPAAKNASYLYAAPWTCKTAEFNSNPAAVRSLNLDTNFPNWQNAGGRHVEWLPKFGDDFQSFVRPSKVSFWWCHWFQWPGQMSWHESSFNFEDLETKMCSIRPPGPTNHFTQKMHPWTIAISKVFGASP